MSSDLSVVPDDQAFLKWDLGGTAREHGYTGDQIAVLRTVVDHLIPTVEPFPAPSSLDLVEDFITRYVAPGGSQPRFFPYLNEETLAGFADQLGKAFLDADEASRTERLKELETGQTELFMKVVSLTYYGYYSRPEVVSVVRRHLPGGRDFHGPPQPYGYLDTILDWDQAPAPPKDRGSYTRTDEVSRLDLSRLGDGDALARRVMFPPGHPLEGNGTAG